MPNFKSQLRSLPKTMRRQFRSLGQGQRRSLRALANIGEVAMAEGRSSTIAAILQNTTDQFGLVIERYGVTPDQQDFQVYSRTAEQNFFN